MKTILSAALVLGLCALAGAGARRAEADPVGTWKVRVRDRRAESGCPHCRSRTTGNKLAGR